MTGIVTALTTKTAAITGAIAVTMIAAAIISVTVIATIAGTMIGTTTDIVRTADTKAWGVRAQDAGADTLSAPSAGGLLRIIWRTSKRTMTDVWGPISHLKIE